MAWQAVGVMGYARLGRALDLVYIAVYSFGAFCGGQLFAAEHQPTLRWLGRIIMSAAVIIAVADNIETVCQFIHAIRFAGNDVLAYTAVTAQLINSAAFLTSFFCIVMALFPRKRGRRAE